MTYQYMIIILLYTTIVIQSSSIDDQLVLHLPFNGSFLDYSKFKNTVTNVGAVLANDRYGIARSAYYFDGIDDYMYINSTASLDFNSNNISISVWVYVHSGEDNYILYDGPGSRSAFALAHENKTISNTSQYDSFCIDFWNQAGQRIRCPRGVGNFIHASFVWHHLVGVLDGQTARFYVNGILEKEFPFVGTIRKNTVDGVEIGRYCCASTYFFHGRIDDIRFYNLSLTDDQAHELFVSDTISETNGETTGDTQMRYVETADETNSPSGDTEFLTFDTEAVDETNSPSDETEFLTFDTEAVDETNSPSDDTEFLTVDTNAVGDGSTWIVALVVSLSLVFVCLILFVCLAAVVVVIAVLVYKGKSKKDEDTELSAITPEKGRDDLPIVDPEDKIKRNENNEKLQQIHEGDGAETKETKIIDHKLEAKQRKAEEKKRKKELKELKKMKKQEEKLRKKLEKSGGPKFVIENPKEPTMLNICVVGDGIYFLVDFLNFVGSVGKTSLLYVFRDGSFPEEYIPTVFDNYRKETEVMIGNKEYNVAFNLKDTAGQEDYKSLRTLSYSGVDVFILCFCVTSVDSFKNITVRWVNELREYCEPHQVIVVGTKIDLRSEEVEMVTKEMGEKLVKEIGASHYVECSAKENIEVVEIFVKAFGVLIKHGRARKE